MRHLERGQEIRNVHAITWLGIYHLVKTVSKANDIFLKKLTSLNVVCRVPSNAVMKNKMGNISTCLICSWNTGFLDI